MNVQKVNEKLRKELMALRSEIKVLQNSSNKIPTPKAFQKLALQVREKLQFGIYSPPKIPRQKSPISALSKKSSLAPEISRKNSNALENTKENLGIEFKSPHFPESKEGKNSKCLPIESKSPIPCVEEIQKLEQENEILRKLHNLQKENQKLREKVGLGPEPKHMNSKKKVKREENKRKNSSLIGSLEILTSSYQGRKSPFVQEVQSSKYLLKKPIVYKKKSRVLGSRHLSAQVHVVENLKKNRSKSVPSKHHHKSSSSFSFTNSVRESHRVCLKCKDFSKSFSSLNVKEAPQTDAFGLVSSKICEKCE